MNAALEIADKQGTSATCKALGVPRASFYRQRAKAIGPRPRRPSPPRRVSDNERENVLSILHEPRFADLAVPQVHATLLEEGRYLCSARTMYRILAENSEVRERRDQLRHPHYTAPQLLATGPNQVWSWDITKLLGQSKWGLLLPLRLARHLQPVRRGVDAGRARIRNTRFQARGRGVSSRRHRAWAAHTPLRSRRAYDQ